MIASTHILDILEQAQIEPPKARAIAKAFEEAEREILDEVKETKVSKEAHVNLESKIDYLEKNCMTKQDAAELRAELIKWMFIFWIGIIPVLITIVKYVK